MCFKQFQPFLDSFNFFNTILFMLFFQVFPYLFGDITIIVFVHLSENSFNVSFLPQELFKWQPSITIFVKNFEKSINLSPRMKCLSNQLRQQLDCNSFLDCKIGFFHFQDLMFLIFISKSIVILKSFAGSKQM